VNRLLSASGENLPDAARVEQMLLTARPGSLTPPLYSHGWRIERQTLASGVAGDVFVVGRAYARLIPPMQMPAPAPTGVLITPPQGMQAWKVSPPAADTRTCVKRSIRLTAL
jgi:hypothetical protein